MLGTDPSRKNREGVWQHGIHCRVPKEFNQLLNHVLMLPHKWKLEVCTATYMQLY